MKSDLETTRQLLSEWKSSMADSYRDIEQCMAKSAQEIKESCARILELLQEEIDASESPDIDASESDAEEIDASESTNVMLPVSGEILLHMEPIEECSESINNNLELLHIASPPQDVLIPFPKKHMLSLVCKTQICLSCVRQNVATQSPPPKPPERTTTMMSPFTWPLLKHTMPPPPEPPDLHCWVDSIMRFSPTPVYRAFQICTCLGIAHLIYDEMLNLLVISWNSMLWSNSAASLIGMIDVVKRDKDGNGLETSSQDNGAITLSSGDSVFNGETFTTLEIVEGKYILTRLLHAPPWSRIEDHSVPFSLYVFGTSVKYFQIMSVINIVGCTLAFNYSIFCWSQCYF